MSSKERVLVVDDERNIRRSLALTLSGEGFEVREAGTGEDALAAITREPPHVVFLDINLPGIDGMEVFRNEDVLSPRTAPFLPILVDEAEDRIAREDADDIGSHCLKEVVLDQSEHLEGFAHLHGARIKPVVVAQLRYQAAMDSGDEGASEIDRNAIGLAVVDCGADSFLAGHGVDCAGFVGSFNYETIPERGAGGGS